MIFHCYRKTESGVEGCGVVWTRFPTPKRVLPFRTTSRLCPDCKSDDDRQPRSRKRRKR